MIRLLLLHCGYYFRRRCRRHHHDVKVTAIVIRSAFRGRERVSEWGSIITTHPSIQGTFNFGLNLEELLCDVLWDPLSVFTVRLAGWNSILFYTIMLCKWVTVCLPLPAAADWTWPIFLSSPHIKSRPSSHWTWLTAIESEWIVCLFWGKQLGWN